MRTKLKIEFDVANKIKKQKYRLTTLLFRLTLVTTLFSVCVVIASLTIGRSARQPVLAFTSNRDGSNQIYLFDMATRLIYQLPEKGTNTHSAWSPKDVLAFASTNPIPLNIAILDSEFSDINHLSRNRYWNDYQPAWSSSAQLALATDQNTNWDIAFYDSSQTFSFAPFNTIDNELEPCWWQDGQLSFVSDRDGSADIYKYDFVSDMTVNLTNDPSNDYNPACSSDNQLAFTTTRDYNAEVYVMNLKTGETKNITHNSASDFNPAWLPDGKLSFVSNRDGNREIYVLDLATNILTNISQNPADDDQPAWTP